MAAQRQSDIRNEGTTVWRIQVLNTTHGSWYCYHPSMGPTIFTIGHGEQQLDDRFALLSEWEIEVLVDVRSYPSSRRNPQFNKNSLIGECIRYGIVYNWGVALGGKPRDRRLWFNDETPDYQAMSETAEFKSAITALVEAASEARTVIMCSESRPERCHRALLLQAPLMEEGAVVKHILPNGALLEEVAASKRLL